MLVLDEDTRSLLSGRHEDALFEAQVRLAAYLERREERRLGAKATYEESAKGKKKRAEYNAQHRTRDQRSRPGRRRANRRSLNALGQFEKSKTPPLKGYARIKAWREKNPEKYAAIQKRYENSAKRKSRKR